MFDKIKNIASSQIGDKSNSTQPSSENIINEEKAFSNKISDKVTSAISSTKNAVTDFNLMNKIQDFTKNAVQIVSDIDNHLTASNSSYEINSFRVIANVTVTGGMTLDMTFTKNQVAKAISQESSKHITITNPNTGKSFKVQRLALAGKEKAKVKDPETGEILAIDVKSGSVITS